LDRFQVHQKRKKVPVEKEVKRDLQKRLRYPESQFEKRGEKGKGGSGARVGDAFLG